MTVAKAVLAVADWRLAQVFVIAMALQPSSDRGLDTPAAVTQPFWDRGFGIPAVGLHPFRGLYLTC